MWADAAADERFDARVEEVLRDRAVRQQPALEFFDSRNRRKFRWVGRLFEEAQAVPATALIGDREEVDIALCGGKQAAHAGIVSPAGKHAASVKAGWGAAGRPRFDNLPPPLENPRMSKKKGKKKHGKRWAAPADAVNAEAKAAPLIGSAQQEAPPPI